MAAISSSDQLYHTSGKILTELDPDAPMRQGKRLEPDDENYDKALLRSLFCFIRRGKIEEAISLAVSSEQSWRAASIRGGLYFRDPQLEIQEDDGMSSDFEIEDSNTIRGDDGSDMPAGNPNRFLWKCSCYMISKEIVSCKYERALYAVLCGDIENLLKACDTWEDYLWAYYTCLMDSKIEKFFQECGRTSDIGELPAPPLLELEEPEIFEKLENSTNPKVFHRSQEIYSRIKKHIILNSLDTLFQDLVLAIGPPGSDQSGIDFQVIRFLALLILYLRSIGFISKHSDADAILQHYVFLLSGLGQYRLAILYCSKLPRDQQVDVYASLLSGINEPLQVRKECLRYGCMYGLNYDRVLLDAAEKSLAAAASCEPNIDIDPQQFKITVECPDVPESILLQIRAFEWIDHDNSFHSDTLLMFNKTCRRFLKTGRLWAVACLLAVIPSSLAPQDKLMEKDEKGKSYPSYLVHAAREHMNYVIIVEAFTLLDQWRQTMQAKPSINEGAFCVWEQDIKEITHKTEQALRYALNSNWLLNCFSDGPTPEDLSTAEIQRQIGYLRQIYIPEMINSLFDVLMETRDILPGNVHKAFGLSELIANETLGIYKEIMQRPTATGTYNDLPRLLKKLKSIAILLLQQEELQPSRENVFPSPIP
ncbi:Nucleoporin nup84 [Entomophthora muscae]|uniref:Nucleoporin nup84 n=1 Tax=Entomophthora muscae TaxID=34485 RepID=A0ACC2TES5_9FUNG|nr:Nucleoporin nup84 [Entomophthora muscae]